jgi:hypothetical protein
MSYDQIPQELREFRHFCCWNYETRGAGRKTKIPYNPVTGNFASVSRLDTWVSYHEALMFSQCYDGIGFLLGPEDPYFFIDLDHTEDPDQIEFQKQIFEQFDTYAERSPSGKGLHLIGKGSIPSGARVGPVEIYSSGRYMAMTGDVFRDRPIKDYSELATSLYEHLKRNEVVSVTTADAPQQMDDAAVYAMAAGAANGPKFLRLWNGDFYSDYAGDQSRADFALINMIGFYSRNFEQTVRMFHQSALGKRPKAYRKEYLESMVRRSFDNLPPEVDFSKLNLATAAVPDEIIEDDSPFMNGSQGEILNKLLIEMNAAPRTINEGAFPRPPGLVGDFAKFFYDNAPKPIPEIAIAGALAFMAGICGKAYEVKATGLNLYILLLAGTGRGKESIAAGIAKLLSYAQYNMPQLQNFIGPGHLASGQGLMKTMAEHPTKSFVSIFGEFGITLKRIANSTFENDQNLQRIILDLFAKSAAGSVVLPGAYADSARNLPMIHSPAFSFIGESVPERFYSSIDENMVITGLLPRFIVIDYVGKRPETNQNHELAIPSAELIEKLQGLGSQVFAHLQSPKPYTVGYTDSALAKDLALDRKVDSIINKTSTETVEQIWNRVHLKTRRVAALVAIGVNPTAPVIDDICWDWAQQLVCSTTDRMVARFESGQIGDSTNEHNQARIIRNELRLYLSMSREELMNQSIDLNLFNERVISHSRLARRLGRLSSFSKAYGGATASIKKALQNLIDCGELIEIPSAQMQVRFQKTGKGYYIPPDKF